jgi:mitochondrial enoyl-[acyl-carrier protein] reductase / trans-2-enoyl-CoA reductase
MGRDDMDTLRQELEDLGATHVVTYDELEDKKAVKAKVKEWTNGQVLFHHMITMLAAY